MHCSLLLDVVHYLAPLFQLQVGPVSNVHLENVLLAQLYLSLSQEVDILVLYHGCCSHWLGRAIDGVYDLFSGISHRFRFSFLVPLYDLPHLLLSLVVIFDAEVSLAITLRHHLLLLLCLLLPDVLVF